MDVSATFRQIVREKRSLHSLKTPKDEILPRTPQIKSPFLVEALAIVRTHLTSVHDVHAYGCYAP
jgi:hypothetical protein